MAEHEFSDDPDVPLNKKIAAIWDWRRGFKDFDKLRDMCREIYSMGFSDGESYVWQMRQQPPADNFKDDGQFKWVSWRDICCQK